MDAVTPLGEGDFRPSDLMILPPQHETPVAAYVIATYVVLYSTGVVELSRDTDNCMCVFCCFICVVPL